jgi:hypothetical protein
MVPDVSSIKPRDPRVLAALYVLILDRKDDEVQLADPTCDGLTVITTGALANAWDLAAGRAGRGWGRSAVRSDACRTRHEPIAFDHAQHRCRVRGRPCRRTNLAREREATPSRGKDIRRPPAPHRHRGRIKVPRQAGYTWAQGGKELDGSECGLLEGPLWKKGVQNGGFGPLNDRVCEPRSSL